jgi:magnesium-transporting ATPase (P-type)
MDAKKKPLVVEEQEDDIALKSVENKSKGADLDEHLYLIQFMTFQKWGDIAYKILLIFPLPLLLTFLDYIFNKKIKIWMVYDKTDDIQKATHVLLFKTTENSVEILRIRKQKFYLGVKKKQEFLTFSFNHQRFIYDELSKTFVSLHKRFVTDKLEGFVKKYHFGIKEKHVEKLEKTWGHNALHLHYHTVKDMILEEIASPLGMFEIFSFLVVSLEFGPLSLYALLIVFFFFRSMILQIRNELEVQDKIKEMAEMHSNVIVVRENSDKTFTKKIVPIDALVPGDLIEVIANMPVPADCVLVNGQCVVQESMLTGESTPILKTAYEVDMDESKKNANSRVNKITSKNMLHCGAGIMYTKGSLSESMLAVVVATGFYTKKGALVQTMVDPSKKSYKFYDDAVEFLLILLILSSSSAVLYFIYKFYLAVDTIRYNMQATLIQISEIFFTIVKPSIPICLYAGLELSVARLNKKGVAVLNKFNLSEAAWLSTVCFDKTGTLTEDHMKMQGFLSTKQVLERRVEEDELTPEALALKEQKMREKINRQTMINMKQKDLFNKLGNNDDIVNMSSDEVEEVPDQPRKSNKEILEMLNEKKNAGESGSDDFMEKMMEMKMQKMEAELKALREKNDDGDRELVTIFNSLKKNISGRMISKGNSLFLECFGLCNSIIKIGKKIVGDPIEVEMFENSLFALKYLPKFRLVPRLDEQSIQNKELVKYFIPNKESHTALNERLYQQVKKFDFSNKTKRMTVVSTKYPHSENIKEQLGKGVKKIVINDIKDLDYVYVSCKGAPESLFTLCDQKTIPEDFEEKNNFLSSKGLKVLAMAGKKVSLGLIRDSEFNLNKDSEDEELYQNEFTKEDMPRLEDFINKRNNAIEELLNDNDQDFFEKEMTFLGFYVLENPLRDGAEKVLRLLNDKLISSKIITGDNLFTALNVGKKVGIVGRDSPIFLAENVTKDLETKCCWLQMNQFFNDVDVEDEDDEPFASITEIRRNFLQSVDVGAEDNNEGDHDNHHAHSHHGSEHQTDDEDDSDDESDNSHGSDHHSEDDHGHGHGHGHENEHKKPQKKKNRNLLHGEGDDVNNEDGDLFGLFGQGESKFWGKGPSLIMSGNCFDQVMKDSFKIDDLNLINDFIGFKNYVSECELSEEMRANMYYFAHSAKIFGRCDSDQKTRIINFLKAFKFDTKRTLAFVGDGSNDLQAIKNADTALKLGHSDMSGSTSFVSEDSDLRSLITLMNESKASLANGYHNFSFMIFFIIMQFTGLMNLYITGIFFNAIQLIVMDFALLNLFGFYLPAIEPKKKLSIHSPKHSIWHKELTIFLCGQIASGIVLMTYGYYIIRNSDFYIKPEDIISEEDKHHGHVHINAYKFFDNHYLFLMVSLFSLIYLAVDNREDHFRIGYFSSVSRTIVFLIMGLISFFLLVLPLFDVQNNPIFIVFTYIFRVRLIFSQQHLIVILVSLTGIVMAFFCISILMKFISYLVVFNQKKDGSQSKQFDNKFLKLVQE